MKIFIIAQLISFILIPAVKANFDIYAVHVFNARNPWTYQEGVSIFVNDLSENDFLRARIWPWKDDVSGNKLGMKCQGDGC